MAAPNQLPEIPPIKGMDPVFNQHYLQLTRAINYALGYSGPITFSNDLDLQKNRIKNVGDAKEATDVVTKMVADANYSATALKPQLEANGSNSLSTYKQLNSGTQREQVSSFLNDLLSSPPSASTVFPTLTNSGGNVQVSIPASIFTFADGTTINLQGRTDLLSRPAQYAITSLSVSSGVVTCNCAASGLVAGEVATIVPGTNATFAGTFQLTSSTGGGAVLQMQNPSASGTDSSGFVQVGSIYYYSISKRMNNLVLNGPFTTDNATNRLTVCVDGSQIVAVITITNSGGQVSSSGGGGTPLVGPPASGSFF